MKENVTLTIASLLSILLLTLHITDDIVRGISKAEPSNIALAVLVVLLYGTVVLAERRSGYAIMLVVGLFAVVMLTRYFSSHQSCSLRPTWVIGQQNEDLGAGIAAQDYLESISSQQFHDCLSTS